MPGRCSRHSITYNTAFCPKCYKEAAEYTRRKELKELPVTLCSGCGNRTVCNGTKSASDCPKEGGE